MDGTERKWRLAPIHFDPAKFRKIPGQLPLTPITTEETSSEDDH